MSEMPGAPNGRRRPKSAFTTRQHLGDCVVCRAGVFAGDETARGRGQLLGLLHAECARKAEEGAK